MNITRRRGAIATFITMGVLLVGMATWLSIGWIILNERRVLLAVLGVVSFSVLIVGVVLTTIFLVREVRRNERQDSFLNAVTHELKTPIASIRLYLETLQRLPVEETRRKEFYRIMLSDSDRLLATVEQVLKAGEQGQRRRLANRTQVGMESLVAECIAVTRERHHLGENSIVLEPVPGAVRLPVMGSVEDLRTAVSNLLDNAVKYDADQTDISPVLQGARTLNGDHQRDWTWVVYCPVDRAAAWRGCVCRERRPGNGDEDDPAVAARHVGEPAGSEFA